MVRFRPVVAFNGNLIPSRVWKEDAVVRKRGSVSSNESLWRAGKFAEAALKQYGLQGAEVGLLRDGTKQLFCVSSARGNFVLRTYNLPFETDDLVAIRNAELRSEDALHSQMRWLCDLRYDTRLPVPEPIPTLDGSLLGRVTIEGVPMPRSFALLRWIPGETKRGNLTLSETYLLGVHVARMHNFSEEYSEPKGFVRPRWDWDNLLGESRLLWSLGKEVFSEEQMRTLASVTERIRMTLRRLGETNDIFGIIHGDLQPDNFVVHNGVMYVIDFDHCGYGYYLYDLALTYIHLRQAYPESYQAMRVALLEGYQSVRSLPRDEPDLLEVFVSMRLLVRIDKVLTSLRNVPVDEILARPARLWKSHRVWEAMEFLSAGLER